MIVSRFELHGDHGPFTVNDAREACDLLAQWSRSQMLDIDMCSDGALAILQARQHCFAGGVFEEPNEPGCR